jgi:hypothetical protein
MIKFFQKLRQNLIMENRTERLKTVQWTVLVKGPARHAGK